MTKKYKVAFCGTHSTGKTTLLDAIKERAEYKDFYFITELARSAMIEFDVTSNQLKKGGALVGRFQKILFQKQQEEEAYSPLFVSDRSFIDILAYSYINGGKELGDKMKNRFIDLNVKYDKVFLFPPEFELVDDGVRFIDPKHRQEVHDKIVELLDEFGIEYIVMTGTTEERMQIFDDNFGLIL